jgi:predicted nucleic acid-binding protein
MALAAVIDSGVLIGAMNRTDAYHARAWPILTAADEGRIAPLHVTDFILAETLNYLNRKIGSKESREGLRRLEASPGRTTSFQRTRAFPSWTP